MKSIRINVLLMSTLSLSPFIVDAGDKVPAQDINEARSLIKLSEVI